MLNFLATVILAGLVGISYLSNTAINEAYKAKKLGDNQLLFGSLVKLAILSTTSFFTAQALFQSFQLTF
jgi:hypothetical protein